MKSVHDKSIIERAIEEDAKSLTDLTFRSKSHWDYSKQQLEEWRADLLVSEIYIHEKEVYKLTLNENEIIGYYSYSNIDVTVIKLENLFVEPKFIGQGIGKILMNDFFQRIRKSPIERIVLDADPNVENFYKQIGFKVVGKLETAIKDRFLPSMELYLNTNKCNLD